MKVFHHWMKLAPWALSASLLVGCHPKRMAPPLEAEAPVALTAAEAEECRFKPPPPYQPTPEQNEKDQIYSLVAYAVVYRNWQEASVGVGVRGYNIGSVLVDPSGRLVCWARNAVGVTGNKTQHGEVRLMTNYLHNTTGGALGGGYTVYTTLEPCAMCSGMMTLMSVKSTVYGQADPDFGKALERLSFNSTAIHGFCSYPRGVTSGEVIHAIAERLDQGYARYMQTHPPVITDFLASPEARQIFADAEQQLLTFKVQFPSNQPVLDSALAFLQGVPREYTETPYTTNCQAP
ncbi:nucleoside deaminase [Archangium violaceum]|uniref:nucleoside deaminase n=1 Tax=Archangium violaceum TaxID=83451 RepID=UPI0036DF5E18